VDALQTEVRELRRSGVGRVVLDLRRVEFMDCAGLGVLIVLRNDAKRARQQLTLVPAPPRVQRLFALTRTRGLFDWA
jgi:anti-anti-sigma factor